MYVLVTLTILYVAQAVEAASSETAEIATGPDPAQLWNPESGAAQEKIDPSSSRCMGASSSDGSGSLTQCTGYYYNEGRCTSNSCCQGGSESGYGQYGWCGIGSENYPGGWAYCTAGCDNVPGFDEEDYANLAERVYNIDKRTISDDFKIVRGARDNRCVINQQGCATDGTNHYNTGGSYRCDFEIRKAGFLFLTEWQVSGSHSIRIGSDSYNGDQYFHNLEVKAGDKIIWQVENSGGYRPEDGNGFTVCLANGRQERVVPAPTLAPAAFEIFLMRPDNACEIDNYDRRCITTRNYGSGNYDNNGYCLFRVNFDGILGYEDTFAVEYHSTCRYDFLTINGQKYCGSDGPWNIQVNANDEFEWESDGSVVGAGWKLCLTNYVDTEPEPTESMGGSMG